MFTYGDGVSNINLKKLLKFHKKTKKTITVTAVRPPARFGELVLNKNYVKSFKEKPQVRRGWINGGFFVANSKFLNSISGDKEILEKKPLEKASKNKQLSAYRHHGFWKCMDTLRDKNVLDENFQQKIKAMKIFLTGGSGFIGKKFIKEAISAGHTIYAVTRKKRKKKKNLVWLQGRNMKKILILFF